LDCASPLALFPINTMATATKPAAEEKQYIRVPCDCKGGGYANHYDKLYCPCGHIWWALRPIRSGPLVAYPWPAPNQNSKI
jgi:hypothetical protein